MMNSINLSQQALAEKAKREKARRSFKHYPELVYDGYKKNWHTDVICEALDDVYNGKIRFFLVEEPPRHSKSLHVSQLFPSWVFGKNEDDSVIVASYSGDLAADHGRATRELMNSTKYQNIFKTKLAPDSKAKSKFNTTGKGAYNAAGVGGSITGKGAKFFIIDDPFKDRKEADSILIRDDRDKWRKSVARTRLTPDGGMIITHTRWHDDDLVGRIIAEKDWIDYFEYKEKGLCGKKWVRLRLTAIAEKDELYRKQGEALWANHYNLTELEDIKKDLGGYEWSALYQQNPIDEENRVFNPAWFKTKEYSEIENLNTVNYLTIDTKATAEANAGTDYVGLTLNFIDNQNQWHLMSERRKMSLKDLVDLLFTWHTNYKLAKIGIEKTAFTEGMQLYLQEEQRKRNHYLPLVDLKHGGTKKELRIESLQPRYENGNIYHLIRYSKNQCADLEEELLRFPKAINDDASDSAAYQNQIVEFVVNDDDIEEVMLYNSDYI